MEGVDTWGLIKENVCSLFSWFAVLPSHALNSLHKHLHLVFWQKLLSKVPPGERLSDLGVRWCDELQFSLKVILSVGLLLTKTVLHRSQCSAARCAASTSWFSHFFYIKLVQISWIQFNRLQLRFSSSPTILVPAMHHTAASLWRTDSWNHSEPPTQSYQVGTQSQFDVEPHLDLLLSLISVPKI